MAAKSDLNAPGAMSPFLGDLFVLSAGSSPQTNVFLSVLKVLSIIQTVFSEQTLTWNNSKTIDDKTKK